MHDLCGSSVTQRASTSTGGRRVRPNGSDAGRSRPSFGLALPAVGLWLGLVASGCVDEPVQQKPVARPVKMLTIGGTGAPVRLEYPGTVSPAQNADLAFEVSGKIVDLPVEEGQRVTAGTALARLDPRDYEARLASAKAELSKAQADAARGRNLYKEDPGAIAETTLDADRRAVDVATAAYREAEKAVEDTVLRAPFSGRVARKLVKDFKNVQAKESVLVLQDDSTLEIVVNVPERDLVGPKLDLTRREEATARIKPEVVISAIPDRNFPARIKEVATTADPATRTFAATFAFDNPADVSVLPGMTAKVVVTRQQDTAAAVRIPASAVRTDDSGAAFVWVVDPASMTVRRTAVELGDLAEADVEVRSGLEPGDQIAVSGVHYLRPGMQVRRFEP